MESHIHTPSEQPDSGEPYTPDLPPAEPEPRNPVVAFFLELRDDLSLNAEGPEWNWEDVFTFIAVTVLLVLFYYYCRPGFFRGNLWTETREFLGISPGNEYNRLLPYAYWAVMSVTARMLIPCLIIWFVFKENIRDYGYRLVGVTNHALIYLFLFACMLPIIYGVSLTDSFQAKYPFYNQAILGWDHFLLYQLCYGVQFIALEAFFRGFIIFALFKRFGYYSILIMVIPYCMIHFGKPAPETLGAIVAGLVLGYLALKSKSWFYGAMLHWGVGFTMDILAIIHEGGFKG